MALGKNSRGEGRKLSNYCSTVSVTVLVAFCLVGIWIVMSSIVPIQNSVMQVSETIDEVKNIANESGSRQFEDSSGDIAEESTGKDSQTHKSQSESHVQNQDDQKEVEKVSDNTAEENQPEVVRDSSVEKNDLEKGPRNTNQENYQMRQVEPNTYEKEKESDRNLNSESVESETLDGQIIDDEQRGSVESFNERKSDKSINDDILGTDKIMGEVTQDEMVGETEEEKIKKNLLSKTKQSTGESNIVSHENSSVSKDVFMNGTQSEILIEASYENGTWSTQAAESQHEKDSQKSSISIVSNKYEWKLCNTTAGSEYIPCLDNWQAIRKLQSIRHYEHRERHCPDEASTCLVSLPEGYRSPFKWPKSRDMIWYNNAPHTKLVESKGHQNWVKVTGEYLTFPGGGTQFKHGALHYIEFIQKSLPNIAWGKRTRVILDVGCGVASFGGYLFEKDVLTMSFAPKDVHEAQVQFALERGIPATLGVMGSKRLPFPGSVFDLVHCARCRVPWHEEGGRLLLELNRVLRPGGYFVWSATPVYQKDPENVGIWKAMGEITKSMCWDLVVIGKDKLNGVAAAIYRKPTDNECYNRRPKIEPPMCNESDDPNTAWNISLQACMHKVPVGASERGSNWPEQWPLRLEKPPYWLNSQAGVYGRAAPVEFTADYKHWKNVLSHSYLNGMGINWSSVRNVMDMRAVYGGFAAALKSLKFNVWVMNVVPIDSPDTLPIIYERGLFGIYHDWCESFNTYPRSYDLLHADSLFSTLKERCKIVAMIAEVDRMLRPEGYLIIRDNVETIGEMESIVKSLRWDIRLTYSKREEGLLCVQKTLWRPTKVETVVSAIV
ncbi:probable methyltransferase PMT25 [Gastrolobium bilobum]|uniref:probable methyltransferase PMT25 n=1 Tax=Gastrolobium bilobum TaxID=150636 RepID=UPI002AAF40DE|nr:probable methyltransferase PMT25 [Gastrolobium bilobum]XP_061373330.1 probable methyltransferase PMT25 [Gastrolobium bilobum]